MSCICHVLVLVFFIHDLDLGLGLSLFSFWFKFFCRLGCFHARDNKAPIINFNDYSKSSQGHPRIMIIIFSSTTTLATFINNLTTPLAFENTSVKCKRSNVLSPILEALDKNIIMFFDEVECINMTQFDIEKQCRKT